MISLANEILFKWPVLFPQEWMEGHLMGVHVKLTKNNKEKTDNRFKAEDLYIKT